MCFSIFSQFWGGISSHSAAARCTSEPEQYQSFSHLQDLLNSKMCWRWDVDRARRLLPAPAGHTWPSPGGYSGWDGGGASHQFTLDIGEKALDNMTFLKSPSNFSSFKVFIYICWFPIYSPSRVVVMRVAWGYWKTSPSFQGMIEELLCLPCCIQLQQTMQIVWIILNIIQVETVMNNSDYFNAAIQLFNFYHRMTHCVSYF